MSQENIFDNEWQKNIFRFKIIMGLNSLRSDLKDPATQKPAQPHEAMPKVFAQWQQIESTWDKERLIFETIYEIIGQYMKPWQTANLLNVIRQPFDALEFLQENISNDLDPEDDIQTCASLSKTLINLTYYQDALNWAYKAYQNAKNNYRIQIIIADSLLLSGEEELAFHSRIAILRH